jgi:hypothetical protein
LTDGRTDGESKNNMSKIKFKVKFHLIFLIVLSEGVSVTEWPRLLTLPVMLDGNHIMTFTVLMHCKNQSKKNILNI